MSKLPSSIRWVVFDMVDTLIFADPPVHMAYHRIGRKYGSSITPELAFHRFRACYAAELRTVASDSSIPPGRTSEDCEEAFWRRVVEQVLPDVDSRSDCFQELFEHFARPDSWGCYPDVEDVCTELHARGLRLAAASNFDARLHRVHAGHPACGLLSPCLASSELGWRKPAPEFFAAVADRCGARPEELLMVGDDPQHDVAAARAAGWSAVQLDRSGRTPGALRFLEDLLAMVPRAP